MNGFHKHVLELVDAHLAGALPPHEAAYVNRHCETCPICRVALEEARKRQEAVAGLPPAEASEELIQATERKIDRAVKRSRMLGPAERLVTMSWTARGFSLAAAAALVIGILHAYYLNLAPSPYDLRVLGQTELLAGTDSSLRVVMYNRETDRVVPEIPVEIQLVSADRERTVQLASFTTDAQGSGRPRFQWPDWEEGEYALRVAAQTGEGREMIERTVRLQRSWRLMLSTDKPVYQPGQTIRVRSLALRRPDLKPVAGREVVFTVTDPKGNMIFKQTGVTSRFGIASMECLLADEILHGAYRVECRIGETASAQTVEVKKYTLPKFEVAVELEEPYYQPGERVRGTVQADYFFGKPVGGAEVTIDVQTTDVERRSLEEIHVTADETGKAEFEFRLPEMLVGREQNSGDARIFLNVSVTDSAGQEESATVSRIVTAEPVRIEVIPEAGRLVRGVSNRVYIVTTYADGRPAATRMAVSGFEEEFATSELGVAVVELAPRSETLRWTLRAADEAGKIGRRRVELQTGRAREDFLLRPDKAVYDGGETMRLVALGSGSEPVFLDLIKDGQTLVTDAIEMSAGRGEYAFDLPPELFGTVELVAYRYGGAGLPVRKSRVIYIRQAGDLQIEAELDRAEYRPGRQAQLNLRLTDKSGNPAPGAVSLAAVDEAVFSVLEQAPGMEQTFFTLEEELLQPVYAVYPWSPVLGGEVPAEEREQFEQALFAQTAGRPRNKLENLKEQLLPYLDNYDRIFDVLKRDDWQELLADGYIPEETLNILQNHGDAHSLSAVSYLAKTRRITSTRQTGIGIIFWLWLGYVVGVILFVAYLVGSGTRVLECVVVFAIICVLIPLLLPAVQQSRESARRTEARSQLKEIGLAAANFMEREGRFPTGDDGVGGFGDVADEDGLEAAKTPRPRVREWFPETLLWRPEVITDDAGRASIEIDLADSITTWRLSASAVSGSGQLGAVQRPLKVFQPFFVDLNLPVALTRGDEAGVPVVVYNYLEEPQRVTLVLEEGEWFTALDERTKTLELGPGEVRSVRFGLRVNRVGDHTLQVTARGGGPPPLVADALKKPIEVVPDGRRVEQVFSGTLAQPAEIEPHRLALPAEAVPGSAKTIVKLYPSSFSQLVEGLDAIFQRPYGCFEQTSSTTYPNILALDYLRRTDKSVPAVEAKARQYIHLGYQRLLGFEVDGGGFDWFGNPPANRTLTAYGLMEFEDMARVHNVDPDLIERTRAWLLEQRRRDGSWGPEGRGLHDDPTAGDRELARLKTTAYIAWAVYGGERSRDRALETQEFLLAHPAAEIDDPYTLALVANALLAIDAGDPNARRYLDRLEALKETSGDGKRVWWGKENSARTVFYGSGRSGSIETTALAALAFLAADSRPATVRGALTWLAEQKDSFGTWHSTQATVLALKALIAGTGRPLGGEQAREIEIVLDGETVRRVEIPADQGEVMQQIDLSERITAGIHRLELIDRSDAGTGYQVAFRYHTPEEAPESEEEPLSIELAYDRTELAVDETIGVTATVRNNLPEGAPMVIVDLPIPGGFAIEREELARLVEGGRIAKFQVTPRSAVVYLRGLEPGEPLKLQYRLRATMPVKVQAAPAVVYEYYNPERRGATRGVRLVAVPQPTSGGASAVQ